MGTDCYIALEETDGTIRYIYCHFDGYLSGVGKQLYTYYKTRELVSTLVEKGSIVSLELPIHEMKHYEPIKTFKADDIYEFESNFFNEPTIQYYYLFTIDNEWACKNKGLIYLHDLFDKK